MLFAVGQPDNWPEHHVQAAPHAYARTSTRTRTQTRARAHELAHARARARSRARHTPSRVRAQVYANSWFNSSISIMKYIIDRKLLKLHTEARPPSLAAGPVATKSQRYPLRRGSFRLGSFRLGSFRLSERTCRALQVERSEWTDKVGPMAVHPYYNMHTNTLFVPAGRSRSAAFRQAGCDTVWLSTHRVGSGSSAQYSGVRTQHARSVLGSHAHTCTRTRARAQG
jgi:hypothetical protein